MISITKVYHSRCFGTILLIMLCLLLCSPTLLAQYTTASLSGQVVDTTGLLVNDAKVTVVNVGTNDREITQTSDGDIPIPKTRGRNVFADSGMPWLSYLPARWDCAERKSLSERRASPR